MLEIAGADHNDRSLLDGRVPIATVVALADQVGASS